MRENFNIMLDEKPQDWNGYPINADFRIGIQICQLLQDTELTDMEKYEAACELLFSGIMPEPEDIPKVLEWYLGGWVFDKPNKGKSQIRVVDYDVDQWRIYSAFRAKYGINLNTADLHFWEFMGLLTNLEECAYTRVRDIRQKKILPKMSKEEKKALVEAKKVYALDSPEENETVDEAVFQEKFQIFLESIEGKGGKGCLTMAKSESKQK